MKLEDVKQCISDVTAKQLNYRQLRELAEKVELAIPSQISKSELQDMLHGHLQQLLSGMGATSSPGDAGGDPGPGPSPGPSSAVDLLMNEDLDLIALVSESGHEKPIKSLRGLRGAAAMMVVRSVEDIAKAAGLVIRRKLRRVSNTDYGL
jgi:hypothetical protein